MSKTLELFERPGADVEGHDQEEAAPASAAFERALKASKAHAEAQDVIDGIRLRLSVQFLLLNAANSDQTPIKIALNWRVKTLRTSSSSLDSNNFHVRLKSI